MMRAGQFHNGDVHILKRDIVTDKPVEDMVYKVLPSQCCSSIKIPNCFIINGCEILKQTSEKL